MFFPHPVFFMVSTGPFFTKGSTNHTLEKGPGSWCRGLPGEAEFVGRIPIFWESSKSCRPYEHTACSKYQLLF